MPDQLQSLKEFTINHPGLLTWAITALLALVGVWLQRAWIKEYYREWKLRRLIRSIGLDSLHNITVPDGMDGKIFIENLILMQDKILILGVKKYTGLIFAADNIDLWTQVIGKKSYKFENPLRSLENDMLVLKSKLDHGNIEEKVLFIHGAEFPKGKPEKVVEIEDLNRWRENNEQLEVSEAVQSDWDKLSQMVLVDDRDKELYIGDENSGSLNKFSLLSVVMLTTLWLAWRLL